jgi:hypothetical protein
MMLIIRYITRGQWKVDSVDTFITGKKGPRERLFFSILFSMSQLVVLITLKSINLGFPASNCSTFSLLPFSGKSS